MVTLLLVDFKGNGVYTIYDVVKDGERYDGRIKDFINNQRLGYDRTVLEIVSNQPISNEGIVINVPRHSDKGLGLNISHNNSENVLKIDLSNARNRPAL